jgi:hypothetical protein
MNHPNQILHNYSIYLTAGWQSSKWTVNRLPAVQFVHPNRKKQAIACFFLTPCYKKGIMISTRASVEAPVTSASLAFFIFLNKEQDYELSCTGYH